MGFFWFLIRLVFALFMLIFDLILIGVFIIAGMAYVLIGTAARNLVLGLFALGALAVSWFAFIILRG